MSPEKDVEPGPQPPAGHFILDLKKLAEPFPAADIEWRVARAGKKGNGDIWVKCLAYITARAVMDRLDEVVGPGNWKDRYWREGEANMCGLSIRINGEWVEKVDGAESTDIEAVKGGISGALKRAAVKWGIGRYLYNLTEGFADARPKEFPGSLWARDKEIGNFYWAPPALPDWALPPKKPNPPAPAGNGAGVAAKSKATQDNLKERIGNGQKAVSKTSEGQAGGPAGGAGKSGPTPFDDPAPGATGNQVRPEVQSGGGGPRKGVDDAGGGAGVRAAGSGGIAASGPVDRARPPSGGLGNAGAPAEDVPPASPRAKSKGGAVRPNTGAAGPGAATASKPAGVGAKANSGDGASPGIVRGADPGPNGSNSHDDFGAAEPPKLRGEEKDQRALPEGDAGGPGNAGGDGKGTGGGAAQQGGNNSKPIPRTPEEIDWFFLHMQDTLREVKTMQQLAQTWASNASAIAALPDDRKKPLIALKDEIKKKFQ